MSSYKIPDVLFKHCGVPIPEKEYKFHPSRKWRLDYAWPDTKLAVEIEGAIWINGRHTRGSGFSKDMEKYNTLTLWGWHLLRFEPNKINYAMIKAAISYYTKRSH